MVVVEISEKGQSDRRSIEVSRTELTIGRGPDSDIVLSRGNITKHHARVMLRDDRLILVDLQSTNGTYVNGRKVTTATMIRDTDKIYIGDFMLQFRIEDELEDEDTAEVNATELRLLAAIAQHQDGSRMVYADWLEEHGQEVQAEFLRLGEEAPGLSDGERFQQVGDRMRWLASQLPLEWRIKVARPLIENCLGIELACPKEWSALAPTERASVRYCGACQKRVFYCATVQEARTHAAVGDCVAVDIVPLRRPRDLEQARPMRMGMIVPYRDE